MSAATGVDPDAGPTSGAARGDQRRAALLESLDHLLREAPLESINIADISRRAGVTRSAFYFYFENKATAVAALLEEMYDEASVAAGLLVGEGEPAARIEATIRHLFAAGDQHRHVYRAMLEARASSPTVRQLWEADRESFVPPIAAMIEAERAAGRAPAGPDATGLATVLLELNDRALERSLHGGPLSHEQLVEAVVAVWLRTIYGTTHAPAPPSNSTSSIPERTEPA